MVDDIELMKRYRLDCAGIMFVVDFIRDVITSPNDAITPAMKVNNSVKKKYSDIWQLKECSSAAVMTWACHNLSSAE